MTQTQSIQVGTAVSTTLKRPNHEGIVTAFISEDVVEIERYGARIHDYVGGSKFIARLDQCIFDAEVNEALTTVKGLRAEVHALRTAREAKGLRLESREEYELRHEADRIFRNIQSL